MCNPLHIAARWWACCAGVERRLGCYRAGRGRGARRYVKSELIPGLGPCTLHQGARGLRGGVDETGTKRGKFMTKNTNGLRLLGVSH